nr:hypothetical protein CFP56_09885 [Quercus suber]
MPGWRFGQQGKKPKIVELLLVQYTYRTITMRAPVILYRVTFLHTYVSRDRVSCAEARAEPAKLIYLEPYGLTGYSKRYNDELYAQVDKVAHQYLAEDAEDHQLITMRPRPDILVGRSTPMQYRPCGEYCILRSALSGRKGGCRGRGAGLRFDVETFVSRIFVYVCSLMEECELDPCKAGLALCLSGPYMPVLESDSSPPVSSTLSAFQSVVHDWSHGNVVNRSWSGCSFVAISVLLRSCDYIVPLTNAGPPVFS